MNYAESIIAICTTIKPHLDKNTISVDADITDDLAFGSLEKISLIIKLSKETGIDIMQCPEKLSKVRTISDLEKVIGDIYAKKNRKDD